MGFTSWAPTQRCSSRRPPAATPSSARRCAAPDTASCAGSSRSSRSMNVKRVIVLVAAAYLTALCIEVAGQNGRPLPGDPLPGLTGSEFEDFRLGLNDFTEVETVADGLGPAFNGSSCA